MTDTQEQLCAEQEECQRIVRANFYELSVDEQRLRVCLNVALMFERHQMQRKHPPITLRDLALADIYEQTRRLDDEGLPWSGAGK